MLIKPAFQQQKDDLPKLHEGATIVALWSTTERSCTISTLTVCNYSNYTAGLSQERQSKNGWQ